MAVDSLSLREPEGVPDTPSDWRSGAHGADYVIISHPEFLGAAERLAGHRRGDGLQVAVVSIEDLYDEFSFGRVQRQAVADFIRHAYQTWVPRPAYVTLFGDATWDYRGIYTGRRDQALVPTRYYLARERGFSPSDYHLALVDGDDLLADLSVGRLTVDSAAEAERVVDKVIAYDSNPEPGDWRSRSVFAANWHAKDEFSGPLDSLAARYTEPAGLQSVRIYAPDEAPLPNPRGKAFLDALNDGALIVNFSGHGAAGAMQFLFSTNFPDWEYLNQVRNGGRLPLIMALSCLNGLFTLPTVEALSELMTEHEDGGAIAFISATALSRTAQNRLLSDQLYSQLFAENRLRFGPVLDAAKARVLAAHSSYRDVVETMQLIGDPAQELALPPGADYAAVDLAVHGGSVTTGATVTLIGRVRNNTRLGADSLTVALFGEAPGAAPDTLWLQRRGPFAGSDSLRFDWAVGDRRGPYRLSLVIDAARSGRRGRRERQPSRPVPAHPRRPRGRSSPSGGRRPGRRPGAGSAHAGGRRGRVGRTGLRVRSHHRPRFPRLGHGLVAPRPGAAGPGGACLRGARGDGRDAALLAGAPRGRRRHGSLVAGADLLAGALTARSCGGSVEGPRGSAPGPRRVRRRSRRRGGGGGGLLPPAGLPALGRHPRGRLHRERAGRGRDRGHGREVPLRQALVQRPLHAVRRHRLLRSHRHRLRRHREGPVLRVPAGFHLGRESPPPATPTAISTATPDAPSSWNAWTLAPAGSTRFGSPTAWWTGRRGGSWTNRRPAR